MIAIVVLLAIAGMATALWMAHSSVREGEILRLRSTVTSVLMGQRERLEQDVVDYAYWDDAWINLLETPDRTWAEENIGQDLVVEQDIALVAVLDGAGRIVLVADNGEIVDPAAEEWAGLAELQGIAAWVMDERSGTGPLTRTILVRDTPMHVSAARLQGHTEPVQARIGPDTGWLLFFRPINLERLGSAVSGTVLAVGADVVVEESASSPRSPLTMAFPQYGPPGAAVTLVVWAWQPSQFLLVKLGAPIAVLAALLAGLGWWAGSLARQERAQREMLARQHTQLLESRQALIIAAEAKARYHRMMAHELRSPLSVIITCAEMMAGTGNGGPPSPSRMEAALRYAGLIGVAAEQLHAMIDDLLDLARVQAGALELSQQRVSAAEMIRKVVAILEPQARETRMALTVGPIDETAALMTDARILERVIYNMLAAALREAPADGAIRIGADIRGDDVRIWVEGQLPAVRDPAGSTRTGSAMRLGLGLPFCEAMLAELGGRLDVETSPGQAVRRIEAHLPRTEDAQDYFGRSSDRIDMLKS